MFTGRNLEFCFVMFCFVFVFIFGDFCLLYLSDELWDHFKLVFLTTSQKSTNFWG